MIIILKAITINNNVVWDSSRKSYCCTQKQVISEYYKR